MFLYSGDKLATYSNQVLTMLCIFVVQKIDGSNVALLSIFIVRVKG
jgi:hypothetical protein